MADYRLTQSGDQVQNILDNAAMRSQVTQETERATGAENQLQQNINSNTQLVGTEETRAKGRENELQQLIQQVNASLINYYLKTETYSATQIDAMLAAIKQFRYQVVDELPTPSAETMGIIYLVPSAHAVSGNIKDEYITLTRDEGAGIIYYFEQIGETAIDLSNYYTKAQTNAEITAAINTALSVYSTTAEMNTAIASAIATAIANYYTKAQTDSLIANFITASVNNLVNYYLKSETYTQAEVNALIAAVHQFTYQSVTTLPTASADTMNKIYLVPSTNPQTKNVKDEFITIATTDQGTTTYSWEQIGTTTVDLSGYSTTEQMNAAISTAIATALANYYTKSQTMTSDEIEAAISAALLTYSTTTEMNTAITAAINTALASYSTTSEMNTAIATAIANYYTKAQVDALIANFITKSVNDLVNYYLKTDTYTKAEVQQLIDAVKQFTYQSVAELPTASADTMNKIYLVPSTNPETKNVKDEYITISATDQGTTTYSWEQIGSTTVDLSGYYTSAQTDTAIGNAINTALVSYSTTAEMNTAITNAINTALASYSTTTQMTAAIASALVNYYTKAEVDALIANFITKSVNDLTYYYLKSETYSQAEINQLIAAVQQFTYQSVAELPTASADTMNKIYLVPSTNPETKNVKDEYITISVTDQGTTTYSWEQIGSTTVDLSGYYTSAQTDTAISNALNTALASYSTTSQMTSAIATAIANYYTKTEVDTMMATKQDVISDLSTIRTGAGLGATAYQKPVGGIPDTDLTASLQAAIASFITKAVNDLTNYYLKSETYTRNEVDAMVAAIQQFRLVSVAQLPTASADTMNKIYLVPSANPQTQNTKDEFITLMVTENDTTTYSWECIGSTEVNLTNYYTKSQTDAAITAAINTALTAYMTSAQVTTAITQALASYYTKTEMDTALAGKQATITDGAKIGLGYGTCSTAATTQAKEVLIANFLLMKNMPVSVLFTTAINVDNATLNISSTGAKPLYIGGEALKSGTVKAGMTATLIYDGTNWNIVCLERQEQSALWVDMGLPSGVKWAKKNIDVTQVNGFAASEYQYECTFYSWGNKAGQNPADASSFTDTWGTGNDTEPYVSSMGAKLTGNIPLSQDTARAALGNPWRMPTTEEFKELFDNIEYLQADGQTVIPTSTTDKRVTVNDITGILIRSVINGNILFFPCSGLGSGSSWYYRGSSGLYWSSSLLSQTNGRNLNFYSGGVNPQDSSDRFNGFAVRAVQ